MFFQNIDAFRRHFERLLERAEALHAVAEAQGNAKAAGLIRQQWLRLRQGPVRALVLGVSSAGKSTLINAVAGQIVVPEGKQTTSPIPVWVCRDDVPSDSPRIRILKKDQITFTNCGRFSYLTDYCYTAAEAGKGTGQEKYRDLEAAVVDVNAPSLINAGVTLIDTPGIGVSRGDNARVQEVLADGCEILVIVFMDLHQQEVKKYFSDLLTQEDAPLGALLDQGRVFLVLNATDEIHGDPHTEQDTRAHIQDAFYGWDGGDNLFVLNALEARLCACGVYKYRDLLPQGYAEEELAHAAATEALEKNRAAVAQPQEDLEKLCKAMGKAVQALCGSDADVNRILQPIEAGLNEAIQLLKEPLLKQLQAIREAEYPIPEELADKRDHLERRIHEIKKEVEDPGSKLSAGADEDEQRWPAGEVAKKYLRNEKFASHYLMDETRDKADERLVKLIQEEDGDGQWLSLLQVRLRMIRNRLIAYMSSASQNPELDFWDKEIARMIHFAEGRTEHGGAQLVPEEAVDSLRGKLKFALEQAHEAGKERLICSGVMELSDAEIEMIRAYFRQKYERIAAGGFFRGVRLFVLYPDAVVEILDPVMERVVREGTAEYLKAFRQRLRNFTPMLKVHYHAMLNEAGIKAGVLLNTVNNEIARAQEQARKADLDRVLKELAKLEPQSFDERE